MDSLSQGVGKMDWKTCCKKYLVKDIKVDKNLISSLISSSSKKDHSQSLLQLNDQTASSKISLAYEALRELLEALAINKGYKIYNHECYCAFLKEILNESQLGDEFDKFRKLRNSINYYGKDIAVDEAKAILYSMTKFTDVIRKLLNKEEGKEFK